MLVARVASAALTALSLMLLLGGCPTPPNGNSNSNSGGNANGNSNSSAGAGQSGAPVSLEKRNATFAGLDEMMTSLSPADLDAAQRAVADHLKADTTIERVGTNDDGSVWARFTDGRPLIVALNRPIPEETLNQILALPPEPQIDPPPLPETSSPRERSKDGVRRQAQDNSSIPKGTKVFLFNTYGPSLQIDSHLEHLEAWLEESAGYQVANVGLQRGIIEHLRFVREAAVLYIIGPGDFGYIEQADSGAAEVRVYAMGTQTLRADDGSTDAEFDAELSEGAVGYLHTPTTVLLPGTGQRFGRSSFKHYFITPRFIDKWWRFVPGAQVYLDIDHSAADHGPVRACTDQGAHSFIGWTNAVREEDSIETAQYYFSRAVGALEGYDNAVVSKEVPNQRPFETLDLMEDMATRQRRTPHAVPGFAPTMLGESFSPRSLFDQTAGQTAQLDLLAVDGVSHPMLRPGISNLNFTDDSLNILTHEEGTLGIAGDFGDEYSSVVVTVGGEPTTIHDAGPGFINCLISPTAKGPVEVEIGGHKSNTRTLTLWTGTANVRDVSNSGVTKELNLEVLIRGDVQSYRARPGEPPEEWAAGFSGVCIPSLSGIIDHQVGGSVRCNNPGLGDDVYSTAATSGYPDFLPLGESGPGFYFRTGQFGVTYNELSGNYDGAFVWGATITDGVRVQVNCTPMPRTQLQRFDSAQGGVEVVVGNGSYDINETDSFTTDGPTGGTVTSTLRLTTTNPPLATDPR